MYRFLLLLAVLCQACGADRTEPLANSTWLIADQRAIEGNFTRVLGPGLLTFGSDSMWVTTVQGTRRAGDAYSMRGDSLFGDSLPYRAIRLLTEDSLILRTTDGSAETIFLRLPEGIEASEDSLTDLLSHNVYRWQDGPTTRTFYYQPDLIPDSLRIGLSRYLLVFNEHNDKAGFANYTWNVRGVAGRTILTHDDHSLDQNIFTLTGAGEDLTAKLISTIYGHERSPVVLEHRTLPTAAYAQRRDDLLGQWQLDTIHSPVDSDLEGNQSVQRLQQYHKRRIFLPQYLTEHPVRLSFSEGKYGLSVGGYPLVDEGRWALTGDGRFVQFDDFVIGDEFMEIREITVDTLLVTLVVYLDTRGTGTWVVPQRLEMVFRRMGSY